MKIEQISVENIAALARLMLELWPDCKYDEEYSNCQDILADREQNCFLLRKEEEYIAFIQLSLRTDYVEGTENSPVAYIEGLYVKPEYQRSGYGKKLVDKGENWGKTMGCKEYASDVEIENESSITFHQAAGFEETNRIVCFVKQIK